MRAEKKTASSYIVGANGDFWHFHFRSSGQYADGCILPRYNFSLLFYYDVRLSSYKPFTTTISKKKKK